uniref:Uncharacterized protein n=1 Tax=Stomoxys calcitrans TaxID=35570 RepID=A0A1I8QB80_STOCA
MHMKALQLLAVLILANCWITHCLEDVEEPEVVHVINQQQQDITTSLEQQRDLSTDSPKREAKRRKGTSPNVHIENIYIPQQIQKGEETIEGYPIYPIYTHPLTSPQRPSKNKHKTKPKPSPTETHLPEEVTAEPSINPQQKPLLIYAPEAEGLSNNDFIKIPYSAIFSQESQTPSTALNNQGISHFIVINTPTHKKQPQSNNKPKPAKEEIEEDVGEEDHHKRTNEPFEKEDIKKHLIKAPLKKSQPKIKISQLDANMGFSLAKFLLSHPSYRNLGLARSVQNKNDFPALEDDGQTEAESQVADAEDTVTDTDTDDQIMDMEKMATPSGNIDAIETEDNETEEFNAIQKLLRLINERSNKLPVDFFVGPKRPTPKIDDRLALVLLRHSKRGRQLLLAENE